jgi:hypothetical protein
LAPTVDAEGKRSVDVQLNALFRHSTLPLLLGVPLHLQRSPTSIGGRPPTVSIPDD